MTANKKYLKQLNVHLTCSPAHRKKFIDDITPLLDEFSNENPQACLDDYIQEFGNPESLADSLLSTLDQVEVSEFKKKITRKKWSIRIFILVVILLTIGLLIRIIYIQMNAVINVNFEGESELIITDRTDPEGIYENSYKETE